MVTPNEHMLMLLIYWKQQKAIRILLDMLKSHGILSADDEQAFAFSQQQNISSNAALFDEAKANYLALAASLGIPAGLERLEEPSLDWFQPLSSFRPPSSEPFRYGKCREAKYKTSS